METLPWYPVSISTFDALLWFSLLSGRMRQGRAKPGAMQAMPLSLWSIGSLSCMSTVRSGPSIAVGCSAQGMVAGLSEGCIDSSWSRIIWRIQREEGAVAELKTISSAASAPVSFMDSRFLCHDLASSLNSSRVACVGDRGDPWSLNASRFTSWFSPASLARAEQHCIPVRRLSTRRFDENRSEGVSISSKAQAIEAASASWSHLLVLLAAQENRNCQSSGTRCQSLKKEWRYTKQVSSESGGPTRCHCTPDNAIMKSK